MDFGPFQPAATAGPVNASASASAPTSGWLSQLQMQEHHLHSSTAQQQRVTPDTGSVDVDISMLGTGEDVAASSSSSMLPSVHAHSHSHSLSHQHQSTHHSMPVSHPHTYYSLSPFPYTAFNYGLSPYSSLPPTSQGSSSGSNNQHQQHWTVPISSYSSLNGATNNQPTASSSSSTPASSSSIKASSRSPLPQHQSQQSQMQSPASPQQQLHSPVLMHQQPQPQYQSQQVQMQAMQSPHVQHNHSSTPTPPSAQHHQLSHAAAYLQQQQSQQSHQQSQITIDPTLMLANYTNSYPPSAFYSYPQQTLSLSPSLLHNSSSSSLASANSPLPNHSSSQLAQSQLQQSGALPSSTGISSRSMLTSVLNGLLSAKNLTSPNQIVRTIMTIGPTEVELSTRLQVLFKVRDCAGNDFFQAWALNTEAMDIIREWLKNAIMSKSPEWEETIMPLLHVIDRLPLTVESLRSSKIGKVIVKLKEASLSSEKPAIKDMASRLENRWRSLVNTVDKSSENGTKKLDGAKSVEAKKRKLEDAALANKAAPAMKKLALSKPTTTGGSVPLTKAIAVKKEPSMMTSAVKGGMMTMSSTATPSTTVRDSKSDSSFFSAPKPKPKLPSFKKAPPLQAAKKDGPDPNVAQPSSVDPFKDALAAMTRARGSPTPSAAVAAANAAYAAQFQAPLGTTTGVGMTLAGNNGDALMVTSTDSPTTGNASLPTTTGKKKKKVAFKAEKDLVQIKFIEPAVYDDDVMGANGIYHNVRDLDRDEGAAMHKQIFEEQIDWMEPLLLDLPAGVDTPRGQNSEEKITQEEREKSALNALYMPSQIPESPAEPTSQIPDDEVDASVKHMLSGNEVRELTPDRGHGGPAGTGGPGIGLLGSALTGIGDMSTMSTLSVQGLISQLAAGLSAVGGSGSGGVGVGVGGLSGLAAPLGNGDIVTGDPAALAAPTQPVVDLKQLGLDINLIAQLASQHPNLTSSSSSTLSTSVNGYLLGTGASQASTGSNGSAGYNDQDDWNNGGPSSSQYSDYSSTGQYEDDGTGSRSKNWDPSSDHSWRGRGAGGRGGRGSGNGRGGSGFRHTKRKLCNFFANGRCRYGDQCDFLHEL